MYVGIPVHNQFNVLLECLYNITENASSPENLKIMLFDNGSGRKLADFIEKYWSHVNNVDVVMRSEENLGVPSANNAFLSWAVKTGNADYVSIMHSDTRIYEKSWDVKLDEIFRELNPGVVGFFGAHGIGRHDLYRAPYELHQLVRVGTVAGNRCRLDPMVHGHRQISENYTKCTVLDGYFLATSTKLHYDEAVPHHMYDNDICLQSIDKGMSNYVVNFDNVHLGGQTDVNTEWNTVFGKSKDEIHKQAHVHFYQKWAPGKNNIDLPYFVEES